MADDSALTSFDQLFAAYSPATVRKVLSYLLLVAYINCLFCIISTKND
ncbi:MAG: hypothetical protein ACTTJE_09815 [Schwartzia sp. (in: firmicutes)]